MNTTLRRLRIAIWAARHADVLTMLHFEALRNVKHGNERMDRLNRGTVGADWALNAGRVAAWELVAERLSGIPGADENRRAL